LIATGCPYPVTKNPLGFLSPQKGIDQIKSDLLILLLTNPSERVMMSEYGTPLRRYLFEQNNSNTSAAIKDLIINSINTWEQRIVVKSIIVTNLVDSSILNINEIGAKSGNILQIIIEFYDPGNIKDVQNLKLEIPI
jgi:phage baseplate assembly protein W